MIKKLLPDKLIKDKKAVLIICIGLIGMILLAFSEFSPSDKKEDSSTACSEITALEAKTEARLEELLSSVQNVGKVKITVTYEGTEEYSYAENEEEQGEGKSESEYVILDENNSDAGLKISVSAPKVRGVAVVCEGGGSAKVREEVTRLVCAALGTGANKVYVSQMKN